MDGWPLTHDGDMVGKRMFWGVVLLAILTLAACIATFSALAGSFQGEVILLNFAMNVPMCIIIGYADYKLVALLHNAKRTPMRCLSWPTS